MPTLLVVVAHTLTTRPSDAAPSLHAAERGRTVVVCLTRGEEARTPAAWRWAPEGWARRVKLNSVRPPRCCASITWKSSTTVTLE